MANGFGGGREQQVPVAPHESADDHQAIAEWRRYNPNQNFLEAGCTVLVEKAVFDCSAHAVADEVS
jgi:hypothetical protein